VIKTVHGFNAVVEKTPGVHAVAKHVSHVPAVAKIPVHHHHEGYGHHDEGYGHGGGHAGHYASPVIKVSH